MTIPIPAGLSITADEFTARLPGRKASVVTSVSSPDIPSNGVETAVDTLTVPANTLVVGDLYEIKYHSYWTSVSTIADATIRIRLNSLTGTELAGVRQNTAISSLRSIVILTFEFTAVDDEEVFVATGTKNSGGTLRRHGSSTERTYLSISKV